MSFALKTIGILFILLSSVFFGYCKSIGFKKRVSELKKIHAGTLRLKEYVWNCPAEIESIYNFCYGSCNYVEYSNGKIITKEGSLSKEDYQLLNEFFSLLGTLDKKSECARIDLYSELIKKQLSFAEGEAEQGSKIWQTCSVCVGIGISILII